jgi:hypothetical protein
MSEICMKGKIILDSLKDNRSLNVEEIMLSLAKMEKEMDGLSKEFEKSISELPNH